MFIRYRNNPTWDASLDSGLGSWVNNCVENFCAQRSYSDSAMANIMPGNAFQYNETTEEVKFEGDNICGIVTNEQTVGNLKNALSSTTFTLSAHTSNNCEIQCLPGYEISAGSVECSSSAQNEDATTVSISCNTLVDCSGDERERDSNNLCKCKTG